MTNVDATMIGGEVTFARGMEGHTGDMAQVTPFSKASKGAAMCWMKQAQQAM